MHKLILLACLTIFITSCSPSKQEVLDKCITQSNETFAKDAVYVKIAFVEGCVKSHGYKLISDCERRAAIAKFSADCYD
ncbi:hypothetical protein MCEKH45_01099 [Methylophilaceae bacterium]